MDDIEGGHVICLVLYMCLYFDAGKSAQRITMWPPTTGARQSETKRVRSFSNTL